MSTEKCLRFDVPSVHTAAMPSTTIPDRDFHPDHHPDQHPDPMPPDTQVMIEPVHTNNSVSEYEGLTGEQIKAILARNRPPPRHHFSATTVSGAINAVCVVIYVTICAILLCFEDASTRYTEFCLFIAAFFAILCPTAYSCCEVPRLRGNARRRAIFGCRFVYLMAALASLAVIACSVLSMVVESMKTNAPITETEIIQESPAKVYMLCGVALAAGILQIMGGSVVAFIATVDSYG